MTRLIELLISLAIVAAMFLIVAVVLPSSRHVSEKVETNRKQTIVFDVVNGFGRFYDWSALSARDPAIQFKVSGPESGKGAKLDYVSTGEANLGTGTWTITDSKPKSEVKYAIENEDFGSNKRSTITLTPTGRNNRNVQIEQTYDVEYGFNLLGRFAGLYVNSYMGEDIKIGLSRLTHMLAGIPNQDYGIANSRLTNLEMVQVPAEHVLLVNSGSVKRDDASIQASIAANQEWIKRTMAANGLTAVGPVRIVTNELGRETYNFDIVQVVRKGGSAAPAADAAEGEATPAPAAATPAPAAGAALNVTTQGPVKYALNPARRAVRGKFTGYFAELDAMRNAVRAWAAVRGYEVIDRPYEVYTGGVAPAFTENGTFEIYWPIK